MPSFLIAALGMCLFAGEPSQARELSPKGLKLELTKGQLNKPRVFATVIELEKAFTDTEALKKEVDFTKEKLVLFVWSGSGGDKLSGKIDKDGKLATFSYIAGTTRDFRRHIHLYAIPKRTDVKVDVSRTN